MDKEMIEVDIRGLAECLAVAAWEVETKGSKTDLYDVEVIEVPGMPVYVKKQVTPRWAYKFIELKTEYESLIKSFSKENEKL